jgi:uncharacterized delta-60 repeat protein
VRVLECASTLTLAQARHLDTTFATRGIFDFQLTPNNGSNCLADAVALHSDGKIVAAGQLGNQSGLIRLNPNGSLDSSFGNGGVVVTKIGSDIDQVFGGVAIPSDGKIVAVGSGIPRGERVERFNTNGSLDTTFGTASVAEVATQRHAAGLTI